MPWQQILLAQLYIWSFRFRWWASKVNTQLVSTSFQRIINMLVKLWKEIEWGYEWKAGADPSGTRHKISESFGFIRSVAFPHWESWSTTQMRTQCTGALLRSEAPGKVLWGWVKKPVLINISYICNVLFCSLAAPCNPGAAIWIPGSADGLHLGTPAGGGKQPILAYSNEVKHAPFSTHPGGKKGTITVTVTR